MMKMEQEARSKEQEARSKKHEEELHCHSILMWLIYS
jgi:hypothetical protein